MQGTLTCPRCNTANIALGAPGCPSCGVPFAPVQAQVSPAFTPVGGAPHTPPAPVATAAAATPSTNYATLGHRFVAGIIDAVIISVPINMVVHYNTLGSGALQVLAFWIYSVLMQTSSWQATLGMKAMHLRLVDEDTLEPVQFARATGRYFVSIVSEIILFIGYFMIAFTEKRQALHDKVARTLVVHD